MHIPVLLQEVLDALKLHKGDIYVDGTLGGGGHARAVCDRFPGVSIVGVDQDQNAFIRAGEKLAGCQTVFLEGNFRHMDVLLEKGGISAPQAILLDIGVSSFQLDEDPRGFSWRRNEPLLMTMKKDLVEDDTTARDIVNTWSEETLKTIFYGFGEERYAGRIARAIVDARVLAPIETTDDLVSIITRAVPVSYQKGKIHPATRVFQALRIAVNDELEALKEGIEKSFNVLAPGGKLLVITFHSLEDRIVKHFFKDLENREQGVLFTKKPITATDEELAINPRSRSAKLRIITKN